MWPHRITVGVGTRAIVVGTDSSEVVDRLEPWRIDDVGGLVDYGVDLHARGEPLRWPRPLPALQHGTACVLRSRDTTHVVTALLRVLASHERPPADGEVRVALVPVARDGLALLVPLACVAAASSRRLGARGVEVVHTVSSLVDTRTARVLVDPPLGSGEEPRALAVGGCWVATDESCTLSPGRAAAEVMQLALGVTADNAQPTLEAVADLMRYVPAARAPTTVVGVIGALEPALDHAASVAGGAAARSPAATTGTAPGI